MDTLHTPTLSGCRDLLALLQGEARARDVRSSQELQPKHPRSHNGILVSYNTDIQSCHLIYATEAVWSLHIQLTIDEVRLSYSRDCAAEPCTNDLKDKGGGAEQNHLRSPKLLFEVDTEALLTVLPCIDSVSDSRQTTSTPNSHTSAQNGASASPRESAYNPQAPVFTPLSNPQTPQGGSRGGNRGSGNQGGHRGGRQIFNNSRGRYTHNGPRPNVLPNTSSSLAQPSRSENTRGPNNRGRGNAPPVGGVKKPSRGGKAPFPYATVRQDQQLVDAPTPPAQIRQWNQAAASGMDKVDPKEFPLLPPPSSSLLPREALTATRDNIEKQHKGVADAAKREIDGNRLDRIKARLVHQVWHRKAPSDRIAIVNKHIQLSGQLASAAKQPKTVCHELKEFPSMAKRTDDMVSIDDVEDAPFVQLWFCEPLRAARICRGTLPDERIAIVNDATSAKEPCAGFQAGVSSDYEDRLLSKTTLFHTLSEAKSYFPLSWNEAAHQVLHSKDVLVWKSHPEVDFKHDQRFTVDVLTCPADDLLNHESALDSDGSAQSRRVTVDNFTYGNADVYGESQAIAKARLAEKLTGILRAANALAMHTVILPPYGLGKGHPVKEVASIMRDILFSRGTYSERFDVIHTVIIAVSRDEKDGGCFSKFEEVFSEPVVNDAGGLCDVNVDFKLTQSLLSGFEMASRAILPPTEQMEE